MIKKLIKLLFWGTNGEAAGLCMSKTYMHHKPLLTLLVLSAMI